MKNLLISLRKKIQQTFLNRGVRITRPTSQESLDVFFKALRPVKTNFELIRVGAVNDGGYLLPNDLRDIDFCFSPGVSDVASFESDLVKRNIQCFLIDYSVEAPPLKHPLIDFEKKFLGLSSNEVFITLKDWINRKAPSAKDSILQMDIEGAEYEVILNMDDETLDRFRIIVIEFHFLENLLNEFSFNIIFSSFKRILKNFEIVHIHPNNFFSPIKYLNFEIPPVMEFTFLKKDRITHTEATTSFPHKLDSKNIPELPDFPLPRCWYL